MLLRAIIIDDEFKGIDTLKILIEKYIKDVKVVAQSTNAKDGIDLIENYKPEIVFLDINMPEMNGFELLEKLTWKNFNLVFTTAHHEYGLKAIKNNAIDYLLKPIDYKELQIAVDKIKLRIADNEVNQQEVNYSKLLTALSVSDRKKILISSKSGIESIDVPDIVYFESLSNYTQIYLNEHSKILTSKILKDFETMLCGPDNNFMRVHNSFIINLHKVSRYLKEQEVIVMLNEQKIPLSKSRKDAFMEWLDV